MTDILLFATVIILSILLYLQHLKYSSQISELVKAVIAKNSQEFVDLKRSEKPIVEKPEVDPEVSLSELPDDKFLEVIDKT